MKTQITSANSDRPIEDLLRDLGLGHRPSKAEYCAREVYHLDNGETFALMTAAEAVNYLKSQSVL